jgi:hypothetical protein
MSNDAAGTSAPTFQLLWTALLGAVLMLVL